MKRLFTLFLLTAITITVNAADRRTDTSNLRIMSFNAEFMWDGRQPEEGRVDFFHRGSPHLALKHMEGIASVIRTSNPDVVSLVEVENLDALKTLNRQFLSDLGYKAYLINGKDRFTGQDMGLLTRIDPIEEKISRFDHKGIVDNVKKSVSKNFIAKFDINGLRLGLIGIHFLSRPTDQSRITKREAQAYATAIMVKKLHENNFLPIVVGDFNDFDAVAPDHKNSQPISRVLRIVKAAGTVKTHDDLINVAQFLKQKDRYTAHWDKNKNRHVDGKQELSAIDHILISQKLIHKIIAVDIPHNHDPISVSDHFPIVVSIRTNQ